MPGSMSIVVCALTVLPVLAQESIKPAPVLQIIREAIKEGRGPAHERVEMEWAASMRKAKHPAHYIALATISGASEVWYVEPMASFAEFESFDQLSQKEPMKTTLASLESRDGEQRTSSRTTWAVYRPDLSINSGRFNPGKAHFVAVGTYRVRLGHDEDFVKGAKTIADAYQKANIDSSTVVYQVVAGAPSGTYLLFTPMDSLKVLDGYGARTQALQKALGAEGLSQFMKGAGETFLSTESAFLQVKPAMSYPPQEMIDADPAFWNPKPAPKPVSPAPPQEKK